MTAMKGGEYYAFERVGTLIKNGWSVRNHWMYGDSMGHALLPLDQVHDGITNATTFEYEIAIGD